MRRIIASSLLALLVLGSSRVAYASDAPTADDAGGDVPEGEGDNDAIEEEALGPRSNLRTRAEEVSFDAERRSLELVGNVRVDSPPFHLRSQRLKISRTKYGIEVEGKGTLAFCPCLGTPLRVDFDQAIVAPPGDLILKNPTLKFYSVPILPLPYFWLRSDEKIGLLPPDIAYRGDDGLFLGGGVHLPWKRAGKKYAIDLRSGAYLFDGFVVDGRLTTPISTTKLRLDRRPGASSPSLPGTGASGVDEGLLVEARGATRTKELSVAWDADLLRGRRGVAATTDLDAAAKPWDRAAIEGVLYGGPLTVATAMRTVARRGGGITDVEAAGPIATARMSGALSSGITYDAMVEGGSLRLSGDAVPVTFAPELRASPDALSFVRAEGGARATAPLGAVEASLALRGVVDASRTARDAGDDRAGSVRGRLAIPLAKQLESGMVHVIEPFLEASVVHTKGDGLLGLAPGRGGAAVLGTAPIADAGVTTSLGRWNTRDALELMVAGGSAFNSRVTPSTVRPLARTRLALQTGPLGASVDGAYVFGGGTSDTDGRALTARARIGPREGIRLLANVATRDGVDPVLARALVDAPLEPASTFLVREGTTGGTGVVIPWSKIITTSGGVDADLGAGELVAARGAIELRDRCGCLTLRMMGSHRIGRTGVDVWIALDFAADR